MVGRMLTRMGMLQRVLVLVLVLVLVRVRVRVRMRMLVLQGRVSRVEPHAAGQRAAAAVGADHARRVGQLVVLRSQAPEPDEAVLGDQHRRARGRRLLVQSLHRRVSAPGLGAPQRLYAIPVSV